MRIRIAMDKLPRHVKGTFYCEECDRIYPIRYMDRHHRMYKQTTHLRMKLHKSLQNQELENGKA